MNTSMIAVLVFLALASGLGAIVLALQDLLGWRASAEAGRGGSATPLRLRRLPRPSADEPGGGPIARFDRWFVELVRESALPWDSTSASLLLVLCGLLLGGLLLVWGDHPLLAAWGMTVGALLPLGYLIRRRRKRIKQLQEQLPAALDMMVRSVRAGQSLDQAMELVGQHSPKPLAVEFRHSARQLELGLGMPAVMRSLVSRVRLDDVRVFTTTLNVQRETGGNVAQALERLAAVIRDRLSYRRQLRAATGAARISTLLVGAIAPLLFLFFAVFQAQYLRVMLESPLGQSVLIMAVVLELVGLIWTARLLRPTY